MATTSLWKFSSRLRGLIDYVSNDEKTNPLKSERENLWKKHKRVKSEEEKFEIENRIAEISKDIFPLTEDLKYCKQIQERMDNYKKEQLYQEMMKEKKEMEKQSKKDKKNNLDK